MIKVNFISKSFGKIEAIKNVSFNIGKEGSSGDLIAYTNGRGTFYIPPGI